MQAVKKAFRAVFKLLEWFAIICMVVMVAVVFFEVVKRYIFKQGFSWSQEVSTTMMVWFAFIGIAIGVLEKIHMSIEMFTAKLPRRVVAWIDSVDYLLIAAFGVLMIVFGVQIMQVTKNATLPATKLPSAVLYIILPLSGALVLLNGLIVAFRRDQAVLEKKEEENDA